MSPWLDLMLEVGRLRLDLDGAGFGAFTRSLDDREPERRAEAAWDRMMALV